MTQKAALKKKELEQEQKWKEDYAKKNAKSEKEIERFQDELGQNIINIKQNDHGPNKVIQSSTKSIFEKKLKIKKVCKHPIYLQIRFG